MEQLLEIEAIRNEQVISPSTLAVGMARLGQPSQSIKHGTLAQLLHADFGEPLHSLAICADLHPLEIQVVNNT